MSRVIAHVFFSFKLLGGILWCDTWMVDWICKGWMNMNIMAGINRCPLQIDKYDCNGSEEKRNVPNTTFSRMFLLLIVELRCNQATPSLGLVGCWFRPTRQNEWLAYLYLNLRTPNTKNQSHEKDVFWTRWYWVDDLTYTLSTNY